MKIIDLILWIVCIVAIVGCTIMYIQINSIEQMYTEKLDKWIEQYPCSPKTDIKIYGFDNKTFGGFEIESNS